ncbi:MAG: hypothetical protein ACF8QF_01210 [Phycisphaerales bacterium]
MNPVIETDLVPGGAALAPTLAQASFFQAPESIEGGGGVAALLFEQPVLIGGALAVVAVVAFLTLNRQEKARLGLLVGGAVLALAAGAALAGFLVETDRERVRARTVELVDATGDVDAARVSALLDDEVDLLMGGRRVPGIGRQVILNAIGRLEGRFALAEARAVTTQASVDDDRRARTQVQVRATPEGGAPSLSWWLLNWSKDADDAWRITRIDCLLFNGQRPGPSWVP